MRAARRPAPHHHLRLIVLGLAALLVATTAQLVAPASARATPPDVSSLRPSAGDVVSGVPTLSWARAGAAARYRVQVSTTSSFASTVLSADTTNSQYVPRVQLPTGELYWRVQVSGESTWSEARFTRSQIAAPSSISPAGGQTLPQPEAPPLLTWGPVPGATSYTVEITTDAAFSDLTRLSTYSTKSASFIVPDLQSPATYYWHVKAVLGAGATSDFSQTGSYRIGGLALAQLQDAGTDTFSPAVQDVVMDWRPVPGAATYDLQVSTDANFLDSSRLNEDVTGITSTRYSRARTLNNDQYYWRVRPVDAAGNRRAWAVASGSADAQSPWKIKRDWPDQPRLQYPADGSRVGDPFYYQWSGTPLASSYTIELSPNRNFSPDVLVRRCTTVHTTYTPAASNNASLSCMPGSGGTYYWRVLAVDGNTSTSNAPRTEPVAAEIHSFTYVPPKVALDSPVDGATVSVPSFTWLPLAGAAEYRVTVTGPSGTRIATVTGTSWTPPTALALGRAIAGTTPVRHEPAAYTWQVQPISEDGRLGQGLLFEEDGRAFTLIDQPAATAVSPDPTVAAARQTSYRFPALAWTPVAGATSYELYVGPAGTGSFTKVGTFDYAAGEDTGSSFLSPGDYTWFVRALGSGITTATGGRGYFTVQELESVPEGQHWAALTGTSLTGALGISLDRCDVTLPSQCENLRQTPVLSWPADPDAAYYRLYLSNTSGLDNLVTDNGMTYPVKVYGTVWTPPAALPDSQAGFAYYWTVVPCSSDDHCALPVRATHAFNKLSRQVTLLDPSDAALRADDVTLTWEDYLQTQSRASTAPTTSTDHDSRSTLRTRSRTEARTYRVQVSDDPNFTAAGTFLETYEVDQRTFTTATTTYPEGAIYWRVQATDGTGNPLAWSEPRTFTKASPAPTCLSSSTVAVTGCPITLGAVSGDQPLAWSPVAFARTYDVEVYKNDDTIGQPANRVISVSTPHSTVSLSRPLPFSSEAYTWRVRRSDARSRKGAWSAWARFMVRGDAPVLGTPVEGDQVDPIDPVFAWAAIEGAATYRWERRNAAGTVVETVETPALSWAPTSTLPDGGGTWRVTGLDNDGKVMTPSAWRSFSTTTVIAVTSPPSVSGLGRVGSLLTSTTPTWNIESLGKQVATGYQWYRGTSRIADATGPTYVLTPADAGREVHVVATGTSPGYDPGTSESNRVPVGPGAALVAQSQPGVTGTAAVKSVLTAVPGTWPAGATFAYQWLRDGTAIGGANRQTYTVQVADAGRALSVRVTASATGYDPGIATSSAVGVAKVASTTTLSAPSRIKRKARAKLTVTVTAAGVAGLTGSVMIFDKAKKVATATVGPASGTVVLRLKKLKAGKHKLRAVFSGDPTTLGSTSATRKLAVPKR